MAKRLPQDSSATFKGIIYQFYQALCRCFELDENEVLYIEKKGDIAVKGNSSVSVEVKHYKDNLTDSHPNVWKTLANLLRKEFDYKQFKHLLLITTQQTSAESSFSHWNSKKPYEKLNVLRSICHVRVQNGEKLSDYQQLVFDEIEQDYFIDFIGRFEIYDCSDSLDETFYKLVTQYTKHLGNNLKSRSNFIKALIGFILSPEVVVENGWAISCEDFTQECEHLSEVFRVNTRAFPPKSGESRNKLIGNELFIQKIKDIRHDEVIDEAQSDYAETLDVINERLSKGTPYKNFAAFQKEVLQNFRVRYRIALRNTVEEISSSQDFYDECQIRPVPTLSQSETPPYWFRNGVIHTCMDDDSLDIKWKLKK